jgi:hypothetical protein
MHTLSPSSPSAHLLSALAVRPDDGGLSSRSFLDALRREASRDKAARIATDAGAPALQVSVERNRAKDLYLAVRRRPELAAGAVAAVALAAGTLLWSQYGRGLLAVGSGYAVERLFGRGLERRAMRLVSRVGRVTRRR